MILTEEGIHQFIEKIMINKFNISELFIKCSPNKSTNVKPYALLSVKGVKGIHQEDTYYENLEENIIACDFSWLEPLSKYLNVPLEATIQVDEDGNFDNRAIQIRFRIDIPKKVNSLASFLYPRIKRFVILNEYIESVRVFGSKGYLTKLYFHMNIDAVKVSKLLKEKQLNRSILNQWITALNRVESESEQKEMFDSKFEVIAGKINLEFQTELVSQYFELGKYFTNISIRNGDKAWVD